MHKNQIRTDILRLLGEDVDKSLARRFFDEGIINYKHARGWLVTKRYWELRKESQSPTNLDIMDVLSLEYDVTIKHIKYLLSI